MITVYDKTKESFGTLVFESDLGTTCETVYAIYAERWMLEMFFDVYKNNLDFGVTRVQSDYSVRGAEFVDLIETILTARIVNRMAKAGVLDKNTFGNVIDSLKGCWRSRLALLDISPELDDKHWNRLLKCDGELLLSLNLVKVDSAKAVVEEDALRNRKCLRKEAMNNLTDVPDAPELDRSFSVLQGREMGRRKTNSSN